MFFFKTESAHGTYNVPWYIILLILAFILFYFSISDLVKNKRGIKTLLFFLKTCETAEIKLNVSCTCFTSTPTLPAIATSCIMRLILHGLFFAASSIASRKHYHMPRPLAVFILLPTPSSGMLEDRIHWNVLTSIAYRLQSYSLRAYCQNMLS